MDIRSVGIIGHGGFGQLLETLMRRFAPEADVRVYSSRSPLDGVRFFSLEDTAACDAVFLSVPIHAFEEALQRIVPHMRSDGIIVDVATVKTHTVSALKKYSEGRPYIATHPMWGPESYAKRAGDVTGFRVVVCESTLPPELKASLVGFVRDCGFDVVEMTAEQHDKHLAETLFLTHFIGQTVARGGFNRTEIDTVSFGFLMDAVESVKHDEALFKDVYMYNPFCEEVLKRFEIAEQEVHALLKRPNGNGQYK